MKTFSFKAHVDLSFGEGTSLKLPEQLLQLGYERPGLIFDQALLHNQTFAEFKGLLEASGLQHAMSCSIVEPTYDDLDRSADQFRGKGVDVLVAVGGGSVLDLAKGISVLLTNPGKGLDYRGFNLVKNAGIPLIAIPTTAGTGSEVTPNAPFINTVEKKKLGINTPLYLPKLAILDPKLITTCPKSVTIDSGLDALGHHSLESFIAKSASAVSRVFSREAFRMLYEAIPQAVERPDDLEARGKTQLGAMLAGFGLPNAGGGGLIGALSYPLSGRFGVGHGKAVSIFILPSVEFNIQRGFKGYDELLPGKDFLKCMTDFSSLFDVPKNLKEFGVTEADIEVMAEESSQMKVLAENPVPITKDDIKEILSQMV